MNTFSRGTRNAFRNKVRTISIVIILSLSVGLIIAMLAARAGVDAKIESIKSSTGNTITIAPAGFRGFEDRVKYLEHRIQELNNKIFPLVNK